MNEWMNDEALSSCNYSRTEAELQGSVASPDSRPDSFTNKCNKYDSVKQEASLKETEL